MKTEGERERNRERERGGKRREREIEGEGERERGRERERLRERGREKAERMGKRVFRAGKRNSWQASVFVKPDSALPQTETDV